MGPRQGRMFISAVCSREARLRHSTLARSSRMPDRSIGRDRPIDRWFSRTKGRGPTRLWTASSLLGLCRKMALSLPLCFWFWFRNCSSVCRQHISLLFLYPGVPNLPCSSTLVGGIFVQAVCFEERTHASFSPAAAVGASCRFAAGATSSSSGRE